MFLVITEDGQHYTVQQLDESDLQLSDDGVTEVFDITDNTSVLVHCGGVEWAPVDNYKTSVGGE
jgi:hypothetical protein